MRFTGFIKLSFVTAAAVFTLGALVGTATAGRLSLSSQTFRAVFVTVEYQGVLTTPRCPLTIEGSFHARTFVKRAASLVGFVTRAATSTCASGSATVLSETLSWHVRYGSFTGSLPDIATVSTDVVGLSIDVRETTFGFHCLVRSTAEAPATLTFTREAGSALVRAVLGGRINGTGTPCEGLPITLLGSSSGLTVLGGASRITLTLI
jgi:hypothetical protein